MSLSAVISMVLICGVVVGGFIYFLILAIRNEKNTNS